VQRRVLLTGLLLVTTGLALFLWKTLVFDLPVVPEDVEGLWRIEVEIDARGQDRRGSVRVPLPSSGPGQVVFDERMESDRLLFTIRSDEDQRTGVWSGRFEGIHQLVHGFRVQLEEVRTPVPARTEQQPPPEVRAEYGGAAPDLPADDPALRDFFESAGLPPADEPIARLRALFAFVADEVATVDTASNDALLTLAAREGSAVGKTRLLVTLLRASSIPSRLVLGLEVQRDRPPREVVWAQAWLEGHWIPLSPVDGFFGLRPADRVALRFGSSEAVESTGVAAVGVRYHSLRERLRPDEIAALMVPPNRVLRWLSLYRLPVSTQAALRALLLFPLGALVVAIFRNLVGVPTFGTFMPVLIAFALRYTDLVAGLALVAAVLLVGILTRGMLDRLRLLLVPRLSVLLCLVVLLVTAAALVGGGTGVRDFFAGVLFPLVILTMLIERFSITTAEEGVVQALTRAGSSTLVAVSVYPIFRSATAQQLMFGFPELVLVVMGLLVWMGGYTGFRAADLIRFRALARPEEGDGS
jgi:transglutaminase-like putative cysteine protease